MSVTSHGSTPPTTPLYPPFQSLLMVSPVEIAVVCLIVFLSYFIKGLTGFGSGLIAMPLLMLMFQDIRVVAPILATVELFNGIISYSSIKGRADSSGVRQAAVFLLAGVLLGALALWLAPAGIVKWAFILFLLFFALRLHAGVEAETGLRKRLPESVITLFGGFTVGVFNSGRAFVAERIGKRFDSHEKGNAALTVMFLCESLWQNILYGAFGLITGSSLFLSVCAVPALLVARVLGAATPTNILPVSAVARAMSVILVFVAAVLIFT